MKKSTVKFFYLLLYNLELKVLSLPLECPCAMHLFVHMANENMPWYIQVKEEGLNKQDVTDLLQSKNISRE